jgi:ribonucleoside-diphosphate reductase subunit M2
MDFRSKEHKRFNLLPIRHSNLWQLYKEQQQVIWSAEEIDFSQDDRDWKTMDKETKDFLLMIIAFFAGSDMLVIDNCMDQFISEVTVAECKSFYSLQAFIEVVHSETYSLMLTKFIDKTQNKEHLLNGIKYIPSIEAKAIWVQQYMNKIKPFEERLLVFIIFEGLLFSASFCAFYWLRTKKLCPGLTFSNELIARDEGLHARFGVEMYKMCKNKLSIDSVHEIFKQAVKLEKISWKIVYPKD